MSLDREPGSRGGMGIGFSIFLIAFGAIIAFGMDIQLSWLDLSVVGWVLMLAGIAGLMLTLYFWNRRRRTTDVVEERHYYEGRPGSPSATERTRYNDPRYNDARPGTPADVQRTHPTEPPPEAPPARPSPEAPPMTQTTRSEYRERPAPPR